MQLAFEAIPFGYGPASEVVAIARAVRSRLGDDCRLVAIGDETSYRLFASTAVFDEYVRFRYDEADLGPEVEAVLASSDAVVSGHSPLFLDAIQGLSADCFVVNTLDWMATLDDETLTAPDRSHAYYAPHFPGVGPEPAAESGRGPNEHVVNPIRNNDALAAVADAHDGCEDGFALVNFGGMDSPLGSNDALAIAMATEIAAAAESSDREWRLRFSGGGTTMERIDRRLADVDVSTDVVTSTRSHEAFLGDLARCELFVTAPGMNSTYEALFFETATMFVLPMNYSQHLQLRAFSEFLCGYDRIHTDEIEPFEPLSPELSEREGVAACLEQGRAFGKDSSARKAFRTQIEACFDREHRSGITVKRDAAGAPTIRFDGAERIASDVVASLRECARGRAS